MREMTKDEKSWLEAFNKMEDFNDSRELRNLGVVVSSELKKDMDRQNYARKTQLIAGKRGCVSLSKMEQENNGEEIIGSEAKFEYTSKGQIARKSKADTKIKQELKKLEESHTNFTKQLVDAVRQGKAQNPRIFTEQKTKNSGYSKLTLTQKLMAKFECEFNKANITNVSKVGFFKEGVVA